MRVKIHTGIHVSCVLFYKKIRKLPWPARLSGLSAGLRTKGLLGRVPVGAHAWGAGRVPSGGVHGR